MAQPGGGVLAPGGREATGRRRLGVLGTMVWDTIHRRGGRSEPVEEWGGISYGLAAASVALPDGWEVVPVVKVGRDLSERAFRFFRGLPRVRPEDGVRVVAAPNNRVELRYVDRHRRTEHLSGGVPPWTWPELAPIVRSCDALYVNFISGFEMELDTARSLREGYDGPTYTDLHSLFLGVEGGGRRVPRDLPSWNEWLRCFDAVQMNEDEFARLGGESGDPWKLSAEVMGPELKLITVTLGPRGAAYVAVPGFDPDPRVWPDRRRRMAEPGTVRSARIPAPTGEVDGDPTGSGDVWGATFFARLLAGETLEAAMGEANRLAARNVEHMGARGLHHHLSGRLTPGEEEA